MKIQKYYKYQEVYSGEGVMTFGWAECEKFNVREESVVISFKKKEYDKIDKDYPMNATRLSDYKKYFISLTDFEPKDFIKIWEDDLESLEEYQKEVNVNYNDGEGMFLFNLANFIIYNEKFSYQNIVYKII